jgi:amino acid transporter
MTQMCGIGPFVTIPIMVATMGGPQAVFGWVLGALLALSDGLVWAELGAAMPGAGGTYIYLREAFQYRTGKLLPFLFIWTAMLTIPLTMATGVIGLVDYIEFFIPGLSWISFHVIGILVVAVTVFLLYRKVEAVAKISILLWIIMLSSVGIVIGACFSHFNAHLAFTFPDGALGGNFITGLGAGLIIGMYDYLGYYTAAYLGDEMANPGYTIPRSILISVVAMMILYLLLNIGVMGILPWQEVAASKSVASTAVLSAWGKPAASIVTILIIITALAANFAGLLGGSRVPFQAARERVFFSAFGKLHAKHGFPHVALIVMGAVTAVGSLFDLRDVISVLIAASIIVQFMAQVVALVVLRRRQPHLHRPYKQWLYPVPCIVALLGWAYVYVSGTALSLLLSGVWIVVGVGVFLVWAKINRAWPYGPREIHEAYQGSMAQRLDASM